MADFQMMLAYVGSDSAAMATMFRFSEHAAVREMRCSQLGGKVRILAIL